MNLGARLKRVEQKLGPPNLCTCKPPRIFKVNDSTIDTEPPSETCGTCGLQLRFIKLCYTDQWRGADEMQEP